MIPWTSVSPMNKAYDPALRRMALKVAAELGIELRQGVYVGLGALPSRRRPRYGTCA